MPFRDVSHSGKSGARQEVAYSHTIQLGGLYVDSSCKLLSGISPQAFIMKDGQSEKLALELMHPTMLKQLVPDSWGAMVYMLLQMAMQHGHYDVELTSQHTAVASLFADFAFDLFRAIACEWKAEDASTVREHFLDPMSARIFLRIAAALALHVLVRPHEWSPWARRAVQERWMAYHFGAMKQRVPSGVITVAEFERLTQKSNLKTSERSQTWKPQVPSLSDQPLLSDAEAARCEESVLNAAVALVLK